MRFFTFSLFCFFIFIISSGIVKGQTGSTCPNSDFDLGNFNDWAGCYGTFTMVGPNPVLSPCTTPGFAQNYPNPGRRHIIMGPGYYDPYTCNNLLTVFPGETYSARLGDTSTGGHAEQLKYQITVTTSTYLFIYRYAVVLESPNHLYNQQPGFEVALESLTGTILDSVCGHYLIYAPTCDDPPNCPTPGGWNYCPNVGNQGDGCYWKDWTTVGMNLSPYAGQTIQIVFTTHGCAYLVHRGYAYLSTYCGSMSIQTDMCVGDSSATLTAPPGFAHYLWSNGDTLQQIVIPHPTTGQTINCILTALNGCRDTIRETIHVTVIVSNFTHGTACSGFPIQFSDSSYVNQNAVTGWKWNFGDGTPIITGNPNPQHTFTLPGIYNVKLVSTSTEGCKDSITKPVTVDTLPLLTNNPLFEKICSKSSTNITLTSNKPGNTFTWTATANSALVTGFSNNTTLPATVINQTLLNTDNKTDTVTYHITPHSATSPCTGPLTNYKVAVKPLPVLTNSPLIKSQCDSLSTNIQLLSNNDSTLFTWTCTASSPDLSGYSNNTTNPVTQINQVIYNSGFSIDTVTYNIIPHSFGCPGDTTKYRVVVFPFPNLSNNPPTEAICSGTSTNITLTSNAAGTLFTWTCTPSSGNLSGFSNNSTPTTLLNQTLSNSGFTTGTVTYNILPHANGCAGHIAAFAVTVYPVPNLSNSPLREQICSSTSTNITLTSNVSGTLFTWTATPSSGSVSGYSNNSIPTTILNQTLINTSATDQTVTYNITPQANGCYGSLYHYVVTVHPTVNPSLTGPISVCTGSSATYTTDAGNSNYTWTISPGGTITAGGGTSNYTVTVLWNIAGSQAVQVNYVRPTGCTAPQPTILNVIVSPRPSPTITGPAVLCAGTTGNVYSTEPGMTNYSWTVSSGGIITAGGTSTSNTVTVTWSLPGTQTVSVNYSNLTGCTAANATIFNVTVNPRPSPTITGPAAICTGTTGNVYTTEAGMTNYNWFVSSGGIITAGGTPASNTVTVTWTVPGTQTVSVNYTNLYGCMAANATIFNVTVNPRPSPAITGPAAICAGTTGNIYTTESGMTNYSWTVSSGGIITAGGSSTSNTVTVTWTIPGSQTVSVNYSNSYGCAAFSATIFNVTVNPLPVPSITGPVSSCTGSTNNVYITQPGMSNYSWNVSSGGTITAGGTSTSNSVTVTWNTIGSQTVSVNYTDVNGCTGAAPTVMNVNIHSLPVPALTGPTYPCTGSLTNVYSTASGMTDYMWLVSQGGTILAGGSATDNTVTVVWNFSGLQSVSVNYTDGNGCEGLNPTVLLINVEPLPVPTINGPLSPCVLSTDNSYITEQGMTSYIWTVSSGGTITSGQGTNSITVTWNSAGLQNVSVLYTDQYGCTPTGPTFFNVTVEPLPGTPGDIIGPTPVCRGATGLVYTVPPVPDAITYIWALPPGFPVISGSGTNTIIITIDTNAFTGNIVVYATNLCGSGQPSPPLTVVVNKPPTGNAGPEGSTCQTNPFTVTQARASNYIAIQWYSSGTGILTGSTTLSPTYTPAQGEIGPVTLTMILYGNAPCGNDTSSMTLTIEPKATVDGGGNQSTCGQAPVILSGSSATDHQSLLWTTTGSGVFNDPTILHPTYTPGTSDITAGSVFLTLHATSFEPCPPDSSRVLLTIGRPVYVNAGPDTSDCQDQPFTLSKAIASGYSTITWSTTGDGTFNDPTLLNPVYTPGNEDIVQGKAVLLITAQGSYPCSPATDSLILTIIRKPTVHPGPDGAICLGMTYTVTGVTASYFNYFTWETNGKGVLSGSTTLSPVYTPGDDETGTVILTLKVFGNFSCNDSIVSCQIKVNIYTPVLVNAGEGQTINYGSTATLQATASGGTGTYSYKWEPSLLVADDTLRTAQTIPLMKDTIFIVTCTDKITGCTATDTVKIDVGTGEVPDSCIVVHNVITPNGDGLNDTWIIDCIENFPDNSVQIFNRWGDRVNNFTHYDNTSQVWKGTNSEGKLLPDGTYYYVLQIKNVKIRTGWILLRGR
jgi:gliding motility-associated-like protein